MAVCRVLKGIISLTSNKRSHKEEETERGDGGQVPIQHFQELMYVLNVLHGRGGEVRREGGEEGGRGGGREGRREGGKEVEGEEEGGRGGGVVHVCERKWKSTSISPLPVHTPHFSL